MKHLNEQQLAEHYFAIYRRRYSFGKARAERYARQHLADCAECGAAYADLQTDLSDLTEFGPPHRDPEYGRRVWESIAQLLPERPERKPFWLRPDLWRGLAYAATTALLLAATFYAGRVWEHSKAPMATVKPSSPPPPTHMVVVVLSDHLERTERLLVELKHANADDSDTLPPLRDEARNLLPANRVCEHEAEKHSDPELENALSSLDRLLTTLADQPGGLDPAVVAHLQEQAKADGLLFEVRVLRSRMSAAEQAKSTPPERGKI